MAAADCVDTDTPPPYELKMYWRIEKYGSPWGTGWMEWPAGMVDRMTAAANVWRAFSAFRSSGGRPEWANANPGIMNVVTSVWRMKIERGLEWW